MNPENTPSVAQIKLLIEEKLAHYAGCSPAEATPSQLYHAAALTVRDRLSDRYRAFNNRINATGARRVYYLCMEFLLGRSLRNNLCNLGLDSLYAKALKEMGYPMEEIYACEPDAGLGNGGLGRLAACFMDSLATLNYPATGFSLCYEYGLFRQKMVDGVQVELPDDWLPGGEVWLLPRPDRSFTVRVGGHVREEWLPDGHLDIRYEGCDVVEAVPYDMLIPGGDSEGVAKLRLWRARDVRHFDLGLVSQGQYARAMEEATGSEIITKVLYPADSHTEGKLLRLTQQYFLVSASCQNILRDHLAVYGTLDNFADKVAIHINDTHPALCIPELMRLFIDDHRFSWEQAWETVRRTVSYTNHTVLPEALEVWNEDLFRLKLPRIHTILKEINERFCAGAWNAIPGNWDSISRMSLFGYGQVRMANLCVVGSHCVNGVSGLHSDILRKTVFRDFARLYPDRFINVTNGVAHRRWLTYANPRLAGLLADCIGEEYRKEPARLSGFAAFAEDGTVLTRLGEIKVANKQDFAAAVARDTGRQLNPDSIFDVHIKRLHEYKRQLLNALNVIGLYLRLCEDTDFTMPPQTFFFAAKAAPGYEMAKKILRLLWALDKESARNPRTRDTLSVVFLENYTVSLAEALIPAAEISEQISLAGKEASGTGCMKLMMNGALTLGTLDGANVEIRDALNIRSEYSDNIYTFGLSAAEVDDLWSRGYCAADYYSRNELLTRILERLRVGFAGESFSDIASYLCLGLRGVADPFLCLADFESYRRCRERMIADYGNRESWNRKSLLNIAASGRFAADRSIRTYADEIWHLSPVSAKSD